MNRGYVGKILKVDLSRGRLEDQPLDEKLCCDYIGGYGFGARWLLDHMPAGADPLGPENILGILTGPLTGTPAFSSGRFVAVCKSPLTGGWGDANCGGTLGPHMKRAGYDGVFVHGVSPRPVYLWIDNGKPELRDASHLWGKDTNETEDAIKAELGDPGKIQIASIGQAGERLSRIACIINDRGRAAGRSGVGGVMGSKKLKAIAVRGDRPIPIYDEERVKAVRKEYLAKKSESDWNFFHNTGTVAAIGGNVVNGRCPVKNWGGVGVVDFKAGIPEYEEGRVMSFQTKRYACLGCPIGCSGYVEVKDPGPYQGAKDHKPEYETGGSFGEMTLMANFPAMIKINDLCNRYGLDTISAGCTIAFAIECFGNGLLTTKDTDGLTLRWGDDRAIIGLLHKMALREGLGDLLAEGSMRAAAKIGRGAEQFAMHIGGQELPMHDPKYLPGYITTYILDATPGRHTQGGDHTRPGCMPWAAYDTRSPEPHNRAEFQKLGADLTHVMNTSGVCLFAYISYQWPWLPEFMQAVTGWDWPIETLRTTGERIGTLRHLFNLREGINPLQYAIPGRVVGNPPQKQGPLQGITIDYKTMVREYLEYVGWDTQTTVPSRATLEKVGLGDLALQFHQK